jgi:hypothetical protein
MVNEALRMLVCRGRLDFHFFSASGCSFRSLGVLGAEVDDARDDFWRRSFAVWFYLAVKPSYMGIDVNGLACPRTILRPVAAIWGDMASLPCTILSCRCNGWWCLFEGCEAPLLGYFVKSWPFGCLHYRIIHRVNYFCHGIFIPW